MRPDIFDDRTLHAALGDLPLGGIRYLPTVTSTNDLAMTWAKDGAADMSLVIAEEQTSGRGRGGAGWFSMPGASLTFSLVLRPTPPVTPHLGMYTGLAALAFTQVLEDEFGLKPQIKWPNDVLLDRKKVCGILVETGWMGDHLDILVIGVGINITKDAIPHHGNLKIAATNLEESAGTRVDRLRLLHSLLLYFPVWRDMIGTKRYQQAWDEHLAYRGERVRVWSEGREPQKGLVVGLDSQGSLLLRTPEEQIIPVQFGEVHLRADVL